MPLPAGTRLGPYEIQSAIGAGGMGEVYKARDTRLGRTVAVKVLLEGAAADPDRRHRFEQEARAASALNHPHICVLHDVGREGDTDFLVLEYLEGQTLAQRLRKGPLPFEQALEYAAQIADALARAHRNGIVHRDLKPANVMLTKDGVKLLDFGLAKLRPGPVAAVATDSTLSTARLQTRPGVGTLPYMAPEQLEGKETDARTDIFAFGCVLYEMLTGGRAFDGDSEASIISAIMSSEPPAVASLRPLTPPALERLVRRCLVKAPDERAQSALDLAEELRSVLDGVRPGGAPATARPPRWRDGLRAAVIAAVVIAGVTAGWLWLPNSRRPTSQHLTLALPSDLKFQSLSVSMLAMAPDGSGAVLALRHPDGLSFHLYWLGLADSVPRELPGTEGAQTPFFSPDGKWLGFSRQGKLLKVRFESGGVMPGSTPSAVTSLTGARGASWGEDGTILFAAESLGGLWRVSAEGGEARQVTWPDTARHEVSHRWPRVLPGGRSALFTIIDASLRMDRAAVGLLSLDDGRWKRIVEGGSDARYLSTGHIVYGRNGTLLAAPFDLAMLRPTRPPVPVLTNVAMRTDSGLGAFDLSANDTLMYAAGTRRLPKHSLVWLDRKGTVEAAAPDAQAYLPNFSLSPDGSRAVVAISSDDSSQLWVYHLSTGQWQRLTSDGNAESVGPIWSPDGRRIAFSSNAVGAFSLYVVDAEGEEPPERLTESSQNLQFPYSWSPDGRFIAYQEQHGKTGWNTFILPLDGDRKPWPWDKEGAGVSLPAFSPDGRWLAYQSWESGGPEVYVRPFPGRGQKTRVSGKEGGYAPVWSPDGREIVYLPKGLVDNRFLGVRVEPGKTLRVTDRHVAFALPFPSVPTIWPHCRVMAFSPGGQRVLTIRPDPHSVDPVTFGELHAITGFSQEVKAKEAKK